MNILITSYSIIPSKQKILHSLINNSECCSGWKKYNHITRLNNLEYLKYTPSKDSMNSWGCAYLSLKITGTAFCCNELTFLKNSFELQSIMHHTIVFCIFKVEMWLPVWHQIWWFSVDCSLRYHPRSPRTHLLSIIGWYFLNNATLLQLIF